MDSWGGLTGIGHDDLSSGEGNGDNDEEEEEENTSEASTKIDDETKRQGDDEIIPWDELPWDKITDLIDPQDVQLTTRQSCVFFSHHFADPAMRQQRNAGSSICPRGWFRSRSSTFSYMLATCSD